MFQCYEVGQGVTRGLSTGPYNLVCVAHPDDETIFFAGLLQKKKRPTRVICITKDGNLDRCRQFERACAELGVDQFLMWDFVDQYERRLPVQEVRAELKKLPLPTEIYTHGILGEYGHPHHQDVCFSVFSAFPSHSALYSVAYNCHPELRIDLSSDEFQKKCQILTEIYGSETNRFLNLIPGTAQEGFVRLQQEEVQVLYDFFSHKQDRIDESKLKAYRPISKFIPFLRDLPRPF